MWPLSLQQQDVVWFAGVSEDEVFEEFFLEFVPPDHVTFKVGK